MKTRSQIFLSLILATVLFWGCSPSPKQSQFLYKNLVTGDGWELVKNNSTKIRGTQRVKKEIWLMNFLHWRKLSNKNEDISVEYVKSQMNNLWGMQFTFTGTEGKTNVNGHTAYFAEGKLREIVKTRFIIWNCPESNRQFIADCNINIARHTPEKLLLLQTKDITNSICCHGSKISKNNKLPQHVIYENENVSFDLPNNWRSNRFIVNPKSDKDRPGHYPNGMTKQRGTVWNLLSNSEKEITFSWKNNTGIVLADSFLKFLKETYSDTTITGSDTSFYSNIKSVKTEEKERYFATIGTYDIITKIKDSAANDTTRFLYKAFTWKSDKTEYLLSSSIVSYNNIWGIPVDLAPTEAQLNEFINQEVLSNITNNPVKENN